MATTEEIDFVRHQEKQQAHGHQSGGGGQMGVRCSGQAWPSQFLLQLLSRDGAGGGQADSTTGGQLQRHEGGGSRGFGTLTPRLCFHLANGIF